MEEKLYVYRDHANGHLRISTIKYYMDILNCNICGKRDKLVFVGTMEEVYQRYYAKVNEFKRLLISDVPRDMDTMVLRRALRRAERDVQDIFIGFDRCNLL